MNLILSSPKWSENKFAQLPHHTRLLWALPFRLGGFGVACAELIKEIAYIAGVASSWPFQDSCGMTRPHASFYNSIEAIKQVYPTIEQEVLDENGLPNMFLQKDLNVLVNNVLSKSLLSSINEQGVIPKEVESCIQAILRARSTPHANDWLQAIPSLQNAIGTVEFQKLLQFHSGLEIQDSPSPCVFGDCDSTDIFGDHAISCKKTNQRIRKHDAIAKILHSHLSDCGFTCALDKGTSNIDQNRMGDVMVQNWYTNGFDNGDLYVDVSVAAPLCSSNIIKSAKEALYSADLRAQEKRKKYQAQTRTKTLWPFVIENLGGLHKDASAFIQQIAQHEAPRKNLKVEQVVRSIHYEISVTLQRFNGQMLSQRCF